MGVKPLTRQKSFGNTVTKLNQQTSSPFMYRNLCTAFGHMCCNLFRLKQISLSFTELVLSITLHHALSKTCDHSELCCDTPDTVQHIQDLNWVYKNPYRCLKQWFSFKRKHEGEQRYTFSYVTHLNRFVLLEDRGVILRM